MTRKRKHKAAIPPQPGVVQRVAGQWISGPAEVERQQQERAFRMQMLYEKCRFAARGVLLFSLIPEVQGVIIANTFLDAVMRQILIANSQIVLPEGVSR